jgi:hypothetical protein
MTPAAILASVPDDVLRAGETTSQRQRQSARLTKYFEQRGHRPTWDELSQERERRASTNV